MKKIIMMLVTVFAICASGSCQNDKKQQENNKSEQQTAQTENQKKTLVAFFSATGTTKAAAEKLANVTGGELFEIVPEQPYTDADLDWRDKQSRSTLEMKDAKSRPAVKSKVDDIKKYDVIYVGFPIWWYIAPTIINTFLEQYDLSGKVIVPFFTSGGSEAGETVKHLQPSAPNAKILPAENLTGDDEANIKKWVDSLKF